MTKFSITKHLKERHLDITLYNSIYISEENSKAYFFLYNLSGQIVGYQCYSPLLPKRDHKALDSERRYHTKITKECNKVKLTSFGLDILDPSKRDIFLVEGVFDACRLHSLGLNSLALLCSDVDYLKSFLFSLGYKLIPVCEGDESGLKLSSLATSDEIIYLKKGIDIGDMSKDEIDLIFSKYK